MDEDDGWTVVRGKGKAAKRSPLKRVRDECCPGGECGTFALPWYDPPALTGAMTAPNITT